VIADASKDLKTGTELERMWQESRTRKAVPPPVFIFGKRRNRTRKTEQRKAIRFRF
jgi:hypothetical protein